MQNTNFQKKVGVFLSESFQQIKIIKSDISNFGYYSNKMIDPHISPAIIEATNQELIKDPVGKKIVELTNEINEAEQELDKLKAELYIKQKQRPKIVIKWRNSIKWCLEVDAGNKAYFLKNTVGVYNCIAFKNKIQITSEIKNKIAITLAALFKEKSVGRIMHNDYYYYGLPQFFTDDLTELKEEYKDDLNRLIL